MVHGANIQDRDGTTAALAAIPHQFRHLCHIFADAAYAGPKLERALREMGRWLLEIVRRPEQTKGFEVLPHCWLVERTLAWLNRNRRLAKGFEKHVETAVAWSFLASFRIMTRRLTRA